mmetsp:Transcript_34864/g.100371  ORF Transcript_34864/g.100371 Transcript_34864/m.100371 type:complete len:334 (-) Transcript_34864:121-1122(-)|eukprot:CAMPEP_0176054294 /NCGR_PEP_ID=MMETSP0120_2-20121206/27013_1 /TAXON_ID=160619 /ORGANISM="Kryptoperidinium foliaceum, Strain CCMP 1326" /LENGTH=333 /DNA_ID=CAMNT_0017387759 /DNA_START=67 /DNA_END=1068 /DNA_ORIENTATION=-
MCQSERRVVALAAKEPQPPSDDDLREDLLGELDDRGAAGELLDLWSQWGQQDARRRRPDLPQVIREAALRCLHNLTNLASLPQGSGWFDAVQLLDLYCMSSAFHAEELPVACAAVVSLLRKSETSSGTTKPAVAHFAHNAAAALQSVGYTCGESLTAEDVVLQERKVLKALKCEIHRPSVRAWLTLLCDRMDVLTQRRWTKHLEWILAKGTASAGTLVLHNTKMTPQQMASGLLCSFLVLACLVPLDALRPEDMSCADWEGFFCESQCQRQVPPCSLPSSAVPGMLSVLQLVTHQGLSSLKADLRMVMQEMRRISATAVGDGGVGGSGNIRDV